MRQTKQLKLMSVQVELHRNLVSLFGVTIASKVKVITGKIDGDIRRKLFVYCKQDIVRNKRKVSVSRD